MAGSFNLDAIENRVPDILRLAEHLVKNAAADLALQIALRLLDTDERRSRCLR